jgi:hypothetical protein
MLQDFRLHVKAWEHHFAAIFGTEALTRVRGFSPSEMALPNHPDIAYEFVKTLRDCGFNWVMERASSHFFEKALQPNIPTDELRFRKALFHLLCLQTSCYRYRGGGAWTDYGREICRRLEAILAHDFNSHGR